MRGGERGECVIHVLHESTETVLCPFVPSYLPNIAVVSPYPSLSLLRPHPLSPGWPVTPAHPLPYQPAVQHLEGTLPIPLPKIAAQPPVQYAIQQLLLELAIAQQEQ